MHSSRHLSDLDSPPPLPPPPKLFDHKVRGWICLNGNVAWESDLVEMFKFRILEPQHFDEEVGKKRKVLLVTAAFNRGHEHRDRHIISLFEKIGIDADWDGRHPHNIQNLSIYTMFEEFQRHEPWIYRRYTEKQDIIKAITRDYGRKNQRYVETVRRLLGVLEGRYSSLRLYDFYHATHPGRGLHALVNDEETNRHPGSENRIEALKQLSRSKPDLARCSRLYRIVEHLVYKDEEVFAMCRGVEDHFLDRSGVRQSGLYRAQKNELRDRVLSSASVFLFGGRVFVLVNRLRFYGLGDVFSEALDRGTNLYGISAGAICMTQRWSLTFDHHGTSHLHAADHGMGLVKGIRIFPHADDFRSIREGRRDDLSFFALRMPDEVPVGLNEKSVVLCETYRDPLDKKIYQRLTSVGSDPVLVFGPRGERHEMARMSQILVERCKFYQGRHQLATQSEILELERLQRQTINSSNDLEP